MQFKQNTLERVVNKITVTKAKQMEPGQFEAILSTDDLDRHGEHVSIKGISVPKDQVIKMYYNHETNGASLPIGKWDKVWKSNGKLMGQGTIDLDDDFALKVYNKIQKGMIDSISVGFYPEEYDGENATWTKSTLVEASVVAEPANTRALITSKELGFTEAEFKKSLKEKLVTENHVAPKKLDAAHVTAVKSLISKGGVADVLSQQDKWEEMEDFWEVIYAFSDAYYSSDAKVTDFTSLLSECIAILQTIADGDYQYEDEDEVSENTDPSGASAMPEIKAAIEDLKSSVGALEVAAKASNESPAIKALIKVRLAAKQVDKTAEEVNKIVRIKLKETN